MKMANDFSRQPSGRKGQKLALVWAVSTIAIGSLSLFTWPAIAQTARNTPPVKGALPKSAPGQTGADQAQGADRSGQAKRIIKARSLAGEGRFEDACTELRGVLQTDPKNVDALYFLGYVLGRQGKFETSISREKNALEIDPNNASAYAVLGLSLGSLHQYSEAARALQQSIKLQPMAPSSYVNLAAIHEKLGDNKGACNLYSRAIAINPQYARAYMGLGEALGKLGDKPAQVEACRMAVKYAPKSAITHAKLGLALWDAGDIGGTVTEGFTANWLEVQESWNAFLGNFLAAWGLVFLGFSLIFAVVFAGSRFKPQDGEKVLRSFFLTFYKDQPGRFVVTDSRLVFVPEIFSSVLGATRVSIQRAQIESIQYLSTMGGGTVSILTRDQSVHQFRMPILVLDPLRSLLVGQALAAGFDLSTDQAAGESPSPAPATESTPESIVESTPKSTTGSSPETSPASAKVKDAAGADAEPEKEPASPPASAVPAELEITEVDSETTAPEKPKAEDNKT